jgi:hypothetical protein
MESGNMYEITFTTCRLHISQPPLAKSYNLTLEPNRQILFLNFAKNPLQLLRASGIF